MNADGSVTAVVVAGMFSFAPDPIEVPAGKPVTFRLTSRDVIHGFEVVGTNANAMVDSRLRERVHDGLPSR